METKNILYIAIVLDEESQNYLINCVPKQIEAIKNIYCHHMTLAFKTNLTDEILKFTEENLSREFILYPKAIGVSNKAIAMAVDCDCPSNNKIKHITMCTFEGGKPVDSNYITSWGKLPEDFNRTLKGTLQIIYNN